MSVLGFTKPLFTTQNRVKIAEKSALFFNMLLLAQLLRFLCFWPFSQTPLVNLDATKTSRTPKGVFTLSVASRREWQATTDKIASNLVARRHATEFSLLMYINRGPFLTSPLAFRGKLHPLGWNLSPRGNVHPFVHPHYCVQEWRGEQRIFPQGTTSPLGDTLTPGVKVCPLRVKLRMGLKDL
jgi:hypothetical protein